MHSIEAQAAVFYETVIQQFSGRIWTSFPGHPNLASIAPTRVEQIATLRCPTGQIIACDPSYSPSSCQPFVDQFPIGEWPVILCGTTRQTDEGKSYWLPIGSYITFHPDIPTTWRQALCAKQTAEELDEGEFWCFGVDGGRACFMDACVLLEWYSFIRSPAYLKQFDQPIDWTPPRIEDVSFELPAGEVANVVGFQAGYGDGCYPCIIGENSTGQICMLLMQFDVFDADVYLTKSGELPRL